MQDMAGSNGEEDAGSPGRQRRGPQGTLPDALEGHRGLLEGAEDQLMSYARNVLKGRLTATMVLVAMVFALPFVLSADVQAVAITHAVDRAWRVVCQLCHGASQGVL